MIYLQLQDYLIFKIKCNITQFSDNIILVVMVRYIPFKLYPQEIKELDIDTV